MILYKIGGLGADERVFESLNLNQPSIVIEWINPKDIETLEDYTFRISKQINTVEEFGLIGVSFGGIIAIELSKILNPKFIILISSVSQNEELPFKSIRRLLSSFMKFIPIQLMKPPQFIMNFMFSAVDKTLLSKIITDTDPKFIKCALHKILIWDSGIGNIEFIRIHGSADRLIPLKGIATILEGGGHFMVVDRGEEVSGLIDEYLKSI